ncbi:MAG: PilZ domain-containing protein [Gemmataceae bacterium]
MHEPCSAAGRDRFGPATTHASRNLCYPCSRHFPSLHLVRTSLARVEEQAVAELAEAGPPDGIERRAFPRRSSRLAVSIFLAERPMAPAFRGKFINISQCGVCLTTDRLLPVGQRLRMELDVSSEKTRPSFNAEVVRASPGAKSGEFVTGCAWLDRLSYADMLRFC